METLVIILFAVILLAILSKLMDFKAPRTKGVSQTVFDAYRLKPSLLVNNSEKQFFSMLLQYVPRSYLVQTKTRLEDVIGVKTHIKGKEAYGFRGRVKSRHIDFLIISPDGRPVLAIELDGKSHNPNKLTNADQLKNGIFATVGLPFLRVRVGTDYNYHLQEILRVLNSP